jgi:lysine-specific histone demethylase 1B
MTISVPQEVLTPQKCAPHIVVRGLVRVRCVQEMDRVLHFMTRKGLINTGVLAVSRPLLPERYRSVSTVLLASSTGRAGY